MTQPQQIEVTQESPIELPSPAATAVLTGMLFSGLVHKGRGRAFFSKLQANPGSGTIEVGDGSGRVWDVTVTLREESPDGDKH